MGEMREISGPYGPETACLPIEGRDLEQQLAAAIREHPGGLHRVCSWTTQRRRARTRSIPADPEVRNFSYASRGRQGVLPGKQPR